MTHTRSEVQNIGGSEQLTDAECRDLLERCSFGRVGTTRGGLPVILSVLYAFDGGSVTFGKQPDLETRVVANNDVISFQIDAYDAGTGIGWSVLAVGRATVEASVVHLHCELVDGLRFGPGSSASS